MVECFPQCRGCKGLARLAAMATVALLTFGQPVAAEVTGEQLTDRLSRNILSTLTNDSAADLALLTQFYIDRDMMPLWVDDEAPTERALALMHVLETSTYDGLSPEDYDIEVIRNLVKSENPEDLAELDFRLSLSLMQFLSDLGSGRTEPSTIDPELFVYPQDIDKTRAIEAAADAENIGVFVGGYRPKQVDYWRLKGVLANYRAIARAGGWPSVEPGPLLEKGDRSPRVAQLRARLEREHDLKPADHAADPTADPSLFDQTLVEAVKGFQERHGLEQDGRVGPNTLDALNTTVEARIEQIILNLERRRWMPDRFKSRYIFINLADFHLQLIDRDKVAFDTPVVIGNLYNKTPVFSADMTYLVINPYWNVPQSIAADELLAKAQADPDYLKRNGFDLFTDWSQNAALVDPQNVSWSDLTPQEFEYKLRQRPGPTNALGRVKFMLPNEFNIYLHDTPNRNHFGANDRSFSHGCVRVARPEALAEAILQSQSDWSLDSIQSAVESGERNVVTLENSLPVQITYLTAWVDSDNRVHFRNDVYERDQILADALINNPRRRATFAGDISTEASLHDETSAAH